MVLRNKETGRTVKVPDAEPEVYVSLVDGELKERTGGRNANLLTCEEVVREREERRQEEIARRDLWRSRTHGVMWAVVGVVIWVSILAYVAQWFTETMRSFLRNW